MIVFLIACGAQTLDVREAPGGNVEGPIAPTDPGTPADPGSTDPGSDPGSDPTNPTAPTDPTDPTDPTEDDCPPGVICVLSLPFDDTNTTVGGPATLDGYSCSPTTDESGPEVRYRVELADEGLLVASLAGLPAGVDVDVHLLEEESAGSCVDRGHWDSAALLPAGTYWVVVDSWVDGSGVSQEGAYDLHLELTTADQYVSDGLTETVLDAGLRAFDRAWAGGDVFELEYGIIDYTLPSTQERFFVLDLRDSGLLFSEMTTHGIGSQDPSDTTLTGTMSNVSGSNSSSVGLVLAAETYWGSNGYSLRLDGLESGFNNNDRTRAIVIHGADYATQDFVDDFGYLGRSWGCPALDPVIHESLIDTLADGRLVLKYFSDSGWLASSAYVGP